ncbi:MAG TPA: ABC transporter permease [Solirubrobacteraceae bacterium]|jgi:lipopolysaccharide transport system permease protein|nr:ABC transporter permease [Solirubrobacteraceae bacterium]
MPAISDTTTLATPPGHALKRTVIEPRSGWAALNLRELWDYRELVGFLTWRDVSVRYKQTALGAAWAVLQPFTTMVVFSLFLGRLAKVPSNGVPYPIFAFAALVPWQFFQYAMAMGATSLVRDQSLITKQYFPRLGIPLGAVMAGVVDMVIAMAILVAMMAFYGVWPSGWEIVLFPAFVLLVAVTAVGFALGLSALAVEFRDVQYVLPFLTQFWLFATPITFPSSIVPEPWRVVLGVNPMAGVVEGFRWTLLGTPRAPVLLFVVSAVVAVAIFTGALLYFRRVEDTFADRI